MEMEVKKNQRDNMENNNSDKNITLFLYKQVRLGKLKPQYISKDYLDKIVVLAREEKRIKQEKLDQINEQIAEKKKTSF